MVIREKKSQYRIVLNFKHNMGKWKVVARSRLRSTASERKNHRCALHALTGFLLKANLSG